jgi:hypothetical protein
MTPTSYTISPHAQQDTRIPIPATSLLTDCFNNLPIRRHDSPCVASYNLISFIFISTIPFIHSFSINAYCFPAPRHAFVIFLPSLQSPTPSHSPAISSPITTKQIPHSDTPAHHAHLHPAHSPIRAPYAFNL